jgi:hypothetical protein
LSWTAFAANQALGPPPEAMTLELPNDLAQPLALDPLGDQHRLELGQHRREEHQRA